MATTQPAQRIYPYLYADDVGAYLDFLARAFGFRTRLQQTDPANPEHVHAETALGDAVVMIGRANSRWGSASPRKLPALHTGLYVYVDDVDAHCRQARAAGATIESEPEDQEYGDRRYTTRDPEGHQWYFATRVRGG